MIQNTPIELVLILLAALLGTGGLAVLFGRTRFVSGLVYGLTLLFSLAGAGVALNYVLGGGASEPSLYTLPVGLPWIEAHFRLDLLSSFFLLVVCSLSAAASLYGWQYGHHEKEPGRVLPFFPLFVAGMALVTVADDAFIFLVAWEVMSLASWLLVLSTHKERDTPHAAYVYIIMASLGTLALFLAFGLLAGDAGSYDFASIRAHKLAPFVADGVLLLTLIGAGAKAGIFPLHAWLPLAHPAAPSHVSALMSGVMTKVAIYGVIRILFDLVGPSEWWWGNAILVLGGITALLGVLYAVMQNDLKKLLAYSTVENIGIIFLGLGLAMAFQANGLNVLAGVALTAALFHVLNHAIFKSLMFMGAGAVLTATGERDMEKMGGLIHRMPVTAFVMLIGAATISALPPFNAFVSEWLTFQAILGGEQLPQWLLKFSVPLVGAMLALAAALAAGAFVKVYGVVFLGRPRTPSMSSAREVGWAMLVPMGILAALCAVLGVLPSLALGILKPLVQSVIPSAAVPFENTSWMMLVPMEASGSSYSGVVILVAVALLASILVFCIHTLASDKVRREGIWDCGFPKAIVNAQYTASSFAQPIRRVFGAPLFGAKDTVDMPQPGELRPARFKTILHDPAWEGLYAPVIRFVNGVADRLDVLQQFTIRRHMGLIFATLIVLLVLVVVIQ